MNRCRTHFILHNQATDPIVAHVPEWLKRVAKSYDCDSVGYSIANADSVENEGNSTGIEDAFLDELSGVVEMDVSRYDIDVRTDDGNEGFVKVCFFYAAGTEQTSMGCAGIAPLDCVGSHGRNYTTAFTEPQS